MRVLKTPHLVYLLLEQRRRRCSNIKPTLVQHIVFDREGRGTLVRVRIFVSVAVCLAVSSPAWWRIFRELSCFSRYKSGHCFDVVSLGQGTECVEMAAGRYALCVVEMTHE